MIIVEGPDNAGKSTLIRQLIALDPTLRLLQRHRVRPELGETIGTSYLRTLIPEDNDWRGHAYGIVDRLLASEEVYGRLYRNGSRMLSLEKSLIIHMLRAYRAIIVFCDPGDEVLHHTWLERDQEQDIIKFGGANRALDPTLIAREYRLNMGYIFDRMDITRYNWTAPDAEAERVAIFKAHRREVSWLR